MILNLLLSTYLMAKPTEEVKIPPPASRPKPVAKLPSTFKEPIDFEDGKKIQFQRIARKPTRSEISATSVVMEQMPSSFGEVVVTDTNTNTVGPFQYVLVRSDRISTGQTYTLIKDMGRLKWSQDLEQAKSQQPHSIQIQGEIKILGTVRVPRLKETLWRAQVIKSFNPIEIGSKLTELRLPKVDVAQKGVPVSVDGMVIGGDLDLRRRLLEPGATVFLDSGNSDSIRVGQLIEVYSTQSLYSVRAALVRVVHVDQQYATAVIVASDREVEPGDRLSRPE